MKKIKLESYISFCVFSSQKGFENRKYIADFDTLKEARDYCRSKGYIIKVECSVTIGEENGPSEFAYGDTVSDAKKNMRDLLRRIYSNYTI